MIDRTHALPIARQAAALGISRGAVYYTPRPTSVFDLALMRRIDAVHLEMPWFGARGLRRVLRRLRRNDCWLGCCIRDQRLVAVHKTAMKYAPITPFISRVRTKGWRRDPYLGGSEWF
jgi:putative transposase